MKIIDFNIFDPFKKIREKMGIKEEYKPNFKSSKAIRIAKQWKDVLTKGLDISVDELEVCIDGTLEHQDFPGEKMIVYIRDYQSGNPKYHISWCSTLKAMSEQGKYSRYVVSQRTDGKFLTNRTDYSGKVIEKNRETELEICKNCLSKLNYKMYKFKEMHERNIVSKNFSIKEFLKEFSTQVLYKPEEYNSNNIRKYMPETIQKRTRFGNTVEIKPPNLAKENNSSKVLIEKETIFKKETELGELDYFMVSAIKKSDIYEIDLKEILMKKFSKAPPMMAGRISKINKTIEEILGYDSFIEMSSYVGNTKFKINSKYSDVEV